MPQVVVMLDASDPSGDPQIWQLFQAAEMFSGMTDVTSGSAAVPAVPQGQEAIFVSEQFQRIMP